MPDENLKYWVAFTRYPRIGPLRFGRILNYFPSVKEAWRAPLGELKQAGLESEVAEEFIIKRQEINPRKEWEKILKEKIKVITIKDDHYPRLLKEIYNPPYLLYYKGRLKNEAEYNLAVVGTRKISAYGKQITAELAADLVKNGLVIISGLALGIDALAHLASVENGGYTIAVLGSGIDQQSIYPSGNRYLARKIIEAGGAIISEHPPGTLALKHHFPNRNRIISGLSLGTLVIEAAAKSGALITARLALEQNREVFAVPGSIYSPTSEGPNNLIKIGARPVSSAEDILDALNLTAAEDYLQNQKIIADNKEEAKLLCYLSKEPAHIDELVRKSQMETAQVMSALSLMEMKGKVKNLGGMNYILSR